MLGMSEKVSNGHCVKEHVVTGKDDSWALTMALRPDLIPADWNGKHVPVTHTDSVIIMAPPTGGDTSHIHASKHLRKSGVESAASVHQT